VGRALWLADVHWDSFDSAGLPAPVDVERYRYVLRAVPGSDEPLIVGAIVTT
jgi:hypothetical protein